MQPLGPLLSGLLLLLISMPLVLSEPCAHTFPFPSWMQGKFVAVFPNGQTVNLSVSSMALKDTTVDGTVYTLIARKPFTSRGGVFLWQHGILVQDKPCIPQCALVKPTADGWDRWRYAASARWNDCPSSPSEPGLEKAAAIRISNT